MKNWKLFSFMTIGMVALLIGFNMTFAGENIRAGISFDFDYTHAGDNGITIVTGVDTSEDVQLEIRCHNANNLAAFEIKIAYDTTKLTYKSFYEDNVITGEDNFLKLAGGTILSLVPSPKAGILTIAAAIQHADNANSPEGSGLLGVVKFTTAATPIVDAELDFNRVIYRSAGGEEDTITEINTNVIEGSINPSDVVAPSTIGNLMAELTIEGNLKLTWTDPGDDNIAIFKYSTTYITEANWDDATTLIHSDFVTGQTPTPSLEVGILKPEFADTSYYFAMKTMDLVSNVSDVSNNARLGFLTVSGTVGLADNPPDSSGSIVTINGKADTTDEHGRYLIYDVTPGTYLMTASREDYVSVDTVVTITEATVVDFVLAPLYLDVAPIVIDLPPDTVFCDSTYAVRARVANLGYQVATFDVYCFIGYLDGVTVYADTAYDVTVAAGESLYVNFKNWQVPPTDSITYRIYVITYLEDDDNRANDTLWKDVFAYCLPYPDVGPISIDSPPDVVISNRTYPVKATIKNFGNVTVTFDVSCTIDGYADTVEVADLAPGDSTTVQFKDWQSPATAGDRTMTVITQLVDDIDRTNDTLQMIISVLAPPSIIVNEIYYDEMGPDMYTFTELKGTAGASLDSTYLVGISGVDGTVYATVALTGNIPTDGYFVVGQDVSVSNVDMVNSAVNWHNGPDNVWLIYVFGADTIILDKVGYGPTDTTGWFFVGEGIPASDVAPGHSIARYPDGQDTDDNSVDFKDFPVPTPGLPNKWSDVAVDTIISPPYFIGCGDTIKPSASVKNEGDKEETFEVICTIKTNATTSYEDEIELTLGVGEDSVVEFKEWNVPGCWDTTTYVMTVYAYLATDMDTTDNRKEREFESVGIEEKLAEAPNTFILLQNNPNPLVSITKIAYQLPTKCKVNLTIYDVTGRLVRTLVDRVEDAGHKLVIWNGKDNKGKDATSGIYFYKLQAGNYKAQKKMILIR